MITPFGKVRVEPLGAAHDRAAFTCGVHDLDEYLRTRAGQDERRNVARVFVALGDEPRAIAGYYTLSSFGVDLSDFPDNETKRLPRYPVVPAALVGHLAVATAYRGRGLGEHLLMNALKRVVEINVEAAIYAVVVDAKDDAAAAFYRKYEFIAFPGRPGRLFLPVRTASRLFR